MGYNILKGANETTVVGWQPSPNVRGTFDVLSTCVLTLLLCVWTAVHLNVPHVKKPRQQYFAKCRWMITAALAPELIVFMAWFQRMEALDMAGRANKAFGFPKRRSWRLWVWDCCHRKKAEDENGEEERPEMLLGGNARVNQWTTTHGFFAIMGGYGLHIPPLPESIRFLPKNEHEHWTITSSGINFLLQHERMRQDIPDLSKEDIEARSRANGVAKLFTCVQALWFLIQSITRLAQGLPISLLELNTCAHALCALLAYCFWWDKPFDIDTPHYFETRMLHPRRATMHVESNVTSLGQGYLQDATEHIEKCAGEKTPKLIHPHADTDFVTISGRNKPIKDDIDIIRSAIQEHPCQPHMQTIPIDAPKNLIETVRRNYNLDGSLNVDGLVSFCMQEDVSCSDRHDVQCLCTEAQRQSGTSNTLDSMDIPIAFRTPIPRNAALYVSSERRRSAARAKMLKQGMWYPDRWAWNWETDKVPVTHQNTPNEGAFAPKTNHEIARRDSILWRTAWADMTLGLQDSDMLRQSRVPNLPAFLPLQQTVLAFYSKKSTRNIVKSAWIVFVFASGAYGSLHVIGWNADFGSTTELLLWRISTVSVASIFLAGLILYYLFHSMAMLVKPTMRNWGNSKQDARSKILHGLLAFLLAAGLGVSSLLLGLLDIGYVVARAYLVVESFINLGHMPEGVYTLPNWSVYVPHIS